MSKEYKRRIILCDHCGSRRVWSGGEPWVKMCTRCREYLKDSAMVKFALKHLEWFVNTFNSSGEVNEWVKEIHRPIEQGRSKIYDELEKNILGEDYSSFFSINIDMDGDKNSEGLLYIIPREGNK